MPIVLAEVDVPRRRAITTSGEVIPIVDVFDRRGLPATSGLAAGCVLRRDGKAIWLRLSTYDRNALQ